MNAVELTFTRSLKILWSFVWRAWVMSMPFMLALMGIMFIFIPLPKPGEAPKPLEPKFVPVFFIVWLAMMLGGISIQAFALKWAFRAKWSDFQIQIVPRESQ